jgi:hypothetical protein
MTPYAKVVSQMGSLSTKDYKMPSNTNIFGDLSQNAMQSQSAMNSAQMGQKNSNQLQSAMQAIQENYGSGFDIYGNKKSLSQMEQDRLREKQPAQILGEREIRDPVAYDKLKKQQDLFLGYEQKLEKQVQDIYNLDTLLQGTPAMQKELARLKDEQYVAGRLAGREMSTGTEAGRGRELLPSGQAMTDMTGLSTQMNMGYVEGIMPFAKNSGIGVQKDSIAPEMETKESYQIPSGQADVDKASAKAEQDYKKREQDEYYKKKYPGLYKNYPLTTGIK